MFANFRLIAVFGRMVKYLFFHSIRQILLFYVMIRIVVGVFVSDSVSQFCGATIMGVLQMRRNRHGTLTFHGIHCLEHGITRGIGFRCCCHIEDRLGKNDLGLRHTNALHRLCRADGHGKCLRIRVSHILCRADHDPAGQ